MTEDSLGEFVNAASNPAAANAAFDAILADEAPVDRSTFPVVPNIGDAGIRLPGGVSTTDGTLLRDVSVKELTGLDEDKILKARNSGSIYRWFNTILMAGTESIGGQAPTLDLLDRMLIGDREFLLTQIRISTFGPEVEVGERYCDGCGEKFDAKVNLTDMEIRPLKDETRHIEVPLKNGRTAHVKIPEGSDQAAFLSEENESLSAQNTALLARVVEAISEKDGMPQPTAGMATGIILGMGIADRRALLEAIDNCQPGPRYDELKVKHECGAEMEAPLGLVSLFPGL